MIEAVEKSPKKLDLKNPLKRREYIELVDRLLEVAYKKATNKYCKNAERIAWVRAITGLVKAGANVLRDAELEDLMFRLDKLEQGAKRKR